MRVEIGSRTRGLIVALAVGLLSLGTMFGGLLSGDHEVRTTSRWALLSHFGAAVFGYLLGMASFAWARQ